MPTHGGKREAQNDMVLPSTNEININGRWINLFILNIYVVKETHIMPVYGFQFYMGNCSGPG